MISGVFGLFRRDAVIGIGGYETGSVGEDMELVVALRRRARRLGTPGRVDFVPDPVASTAVPVTLRELGRQRSRWQRGLTEVMRHHAGMIGNPREGALGMVVAPYVLFVEFLGPWVEAIGLTVVTVGVAVGAVDLQLALLFLLVTYGYGILLNLVVVMLEQASFDRYRGWRHKTWLLIWAIAESVLFRPLNLPWRLHGLWRYVRGELDEAPDRRRRFHRATAPTDSASV
jgi:cellulose synthase/poly-beta-1,6-N-acetylglucosamine synthase-like glycosyltransferase